MELNRYCVKVFADQSIKVLDSVPVFHQWIRDKKVADHMLIDVADYSHVWQGPGIMLVAHEANYSLDQAGGKLGLLYQRKTAFNNGTDALEASVKAALSACALLEEEKDLALKFGGGVIEVSANDRLAAPAADETFAALEKQVSGLVSKLFDGKSPKLVRSEDPKARAAITIDAGGGVDVKALVGRLG